MTAQIFIQDPKIIILEEINNLAMLIYQLIYTIQLSLIFLLFTLFIIFPLKRIYLRI